MPNQPIELNAAADLYASLCRRRSPGSCRSSSCSMARRRCRRCSSGRWRPSSTRPGSPTTATATCSTPSISTTAWRSTRCGDRAGAINAFRESIRLKPDFEPPYINLGRVLEDVGQIGGAIAEWMKLVGKLSAVNGETVAHKLTVLQQAGRVLESHNHDSAAEDVAQAKPRHRRRSGRGVAALDLAAPAAMQMAGAGRMGAGQAQGPADRHIAAVAGQPRRRSDVPARQGLPLRQAGDRPAEAVHAPRRPAGPTRCG